MRCDKISLSETGQFNKLLLDYLDGKPELEPFFRYSPDIASCGECLKNRDFSEDARKALVRVLKDQYGSLKMKTAVSDNIRKLEEKKTFTVTTGHQLNIFTGPLYFIYKIVSVINTCRKLREEYPGYEFVPVYWMASEDHDFDEISSFTLFGKTYTWETAQDGPVGRFGTSSLTTVLEQLPEDVPLFRKAYTSFQDLSGAVRFYINELFGEYGLVVIDADQRDLKSMFRDVMKDDLVSHQANSLVEKASEQLEDLGYEPQVFPRKINLFYMDDHLRGRIVRENDRFEVTGTEIAFNEKEILRLVDEKPELFSPNVILRPLYQERILPNIAYVGGPAEVAYWLQLKEVFKHYQLSFPVLLPRNFAMVVGQTLLKKMKKLHVDGRALFFDTHKLKSIYLEQHASTSINLESEKKVMEEILESVRNKTMGVDQSLEGFIGAEKAKILKLMENMEKRLEKAEEKKHETGIRQLEQLREKLFPGGNLQERVENFLSFYINDPGFISALAGLFDPFDFRFNILYEE